MFYRTGCIAVFETGVDAVIATFKYLFLAFTLSACMGADGAGPWPLSGPMPQGERVPGPKAFERYCSENPADCTVPSSPTFKHALGRIDYELRQIIVPTEEAPGSDVWQRLDEAGPGDCEDFALTFRHRLRRMYPTFAAAFRIATAYTEEGQYHAVLSVETTAGTFVCDIRFPTCRTWESLPYQWRMREIAGSTTWEVFDDESIQTATAAIRKRGRR